MIRFPKSSPRSSQREQSSRSSNGLTRKRELVKSFGRRKPKSIKEPKAVEGFRYVNAFAS